MEVRATARIQSFDSITQLIDAEMWNWIVVALCNHACALERIFRSVQGFIKRAENIGNRLPIALCYALCI